MHSHTHSHTQICMLCELWCWLGEWQRKKKRRDPRLLLRRRTVSMITACCVPVQSVDVCCSDRLSKLLHATQRTMAAACRCFYCPAPPSCQQLERGPRSQHMGEVKT